MHTTAFRTTLLTATLLATTAGAQTAQVGVSLEHLGGGAATHINMGETIRVSVTVSWEPAEQLAFIQGDMNTTTLGLPGSVANITSTIPHTPPASSFEWGPIVGDDILDIDAFSTPAVLLGGIVPAPWGNSTGVSFLEYEWTAPSEQGVHVFQFDPTSPINTTGLLIWVPGALFLPDLVELQATSTASTLVVIPAPGAAATLALASLAAATRRRRA